MGPAGGVSVRMELEAGPAVSPQSHSFFGNIETLRPDWSKSVLGIPFWF